MIRQEPHPISGAIYEDLGEGIVRVSNEADGTHGLFKYTGEWLEGDITQADPHLLLNVGDKDLPEGYDVFWMYAPSQIHDGTNAVVAPYGDVAMIPRTVAKYLADPGKDMPVGKRSKGFRDLEFFLGNDRKPEAVPEVYHQVSPMPGGPQRISTDRYYKQEFHDLEVERIWKKTWQMACREDDIPGIGDYYVYEIAHLSFIIVRTGAHEFKAHVNACLHRGRQLKDCNGVGAKEFRCPFHGWTWKLDGSLKEITTEWDFPGVREDVGQLPGAKLGVWAGFIFLNPDLDAEPLEEFLGPEMLGHYAPFGFDHRLKVAHVQRVVRANWKLASEAFLESYHVITTHPQQMAMLGDLANSHYDVFGHWGRAGPLSSTFPGSPMRGIFVTDEEALATYRMTADINRTFLRDLLGDEVDTFSDAVLNDNASFNDVFPNLHPWGGWARIVFRFRPHGDDPNECIFDVMLLAPWRKDTPRPASAKLRILGPDEPWTTAPELLGLAKIIDQDCYNLPKVHAGLKTKTKPYVWLSSYQEGKVRNFHAHYAKAMGISNDIPES